MGELSKIEWTDSTFNPWIGCARISPGCDNCYAEAMAKRRGWHDWQNSTPRMLTSDANWRKPLAWNRRAEAEGIRWRVFCASLADVFDPQVPQRWRERLWALIEATPHLDWLLLTKRPNLAASFLPAKWLARMPRNVWLGFTAEDQAHYERRWEYVAEIPAAVRFVSYEPAIGRLENLHLHWATDALPDWVIAGGESGPGARLMETDWARRILGQCSELDIAFFFKQWGTYASNPLTETLGPVEVQLHDPKVNGKGGALLDGRLWREFPDPTVRLAA